MKSPNWMPWMIEVSSFLTKFSSILLDAVYPPHCALCGSNGPPICAQCWSQMEPNPDEYREEGPLDFSRRLYAYRGRAAQAVQRLKYERATSLAQPMALALAAEAGGKGLVKDAIAVPVPIHWTRQFERGFNQAELLCGSLPCPIEREWLFRTVATKPQASLRATERRTSMEGVFKAAPSVRGAKIVLVDDVITTGETIRACAAALKAAGALEVGALAFAGNP